MDITQAIQTRFNLLKPYLNERLLRIWAATEAEALGPGGISVVSRATSLSRTTIYAGLSEVRKGTTGRREKDRSREPGAGRKKLTDTDSFLMDKLNDLFESAGNEGMKHPLRWTCRGTGYLAAALRSAGHRISQRTLGNILRDQGFSPGATGRTQTEASCKKRNVQFASIANNMLEFQASGQPVMILKTEISQVQEKSAACLDALFKDRAKAASDVRHAMEGELTGFVIAVVQHWWTQQGERIFTEPHDMLVVLDPGGSRAVWKTAFQNLADKLSLRISVCHLPHGLSRFSGITEQASYYHLLQSVEGSQSIYGVTLSLYKK